MNQLQRADSVSPEDVARFQSFAYFVSIDEEQNRRRFYRLDWREALFEGSAIVRSWGRIGGKGRTRTTFYPDRESAQSAIERMVKQRLKRGYTVVEVV